MANYKVIQDIEAEDKLVGPLTLRQFIYAIIAAVFAYASIWALGSGLSLLLFFTLPVVIFTGFFAFPWGGDQSTEIWALAKIRYFLKSRKRLWSQSGVKDLVQITVPKHIERVRTNGLSQGDVQSRLTALASTLDTRGWAVKNVNSNLFNNPVIGLPTVSDPDRLLDIAALPQEVVSNQTTSADDILENAHAERIQQMVEASTAQRKQQLINQMQQGTMPSLPTPTAQPADYWFTQKPVSVPVPAQPVIDQAVVMDEPALDQRLHAQKARSGTEHLKTIEPLGVPTAPQPTPPPVAPAQPVVTPHADPATIAALAPRNDLNVTTIAHLANQQSGEVVVPLHESNASGQ